MPKKQFRKEIFQEFINSWIFKIIIALSVLITVFVIINYCLGQSYAISMQIVLSSPIYIICGLFLPLLITTFNVYTLFNNNYFLSIRIASKKEQLNELLKNILYSNSLMFVIIVLILLVGLNFICANNLGFIDNYQFYEIPNIIYILFYLIRIYVILMIVSAFNGVLLSRFSSKVVIALNILFYGIFLSYPYIPINDGRTSIIDTSPLLFEYLQLNSFSTFFTEVLCSIFSLLLPMLLLKMIIRLFFHKFNFNIFKYLLINDFSFTLNTKKTLLICYFSYLIVFSLVKIFIMKYNDNGFNIVLGLDANVEENFLSVIPLFINLLIFMMLGTMLFVKDLSKNKSNIFLRINKSPWLFVKIISFIMQYAVLLGGGYLITFIIFSLFDSIPQNVISLYIVNFIILILSQLLVLLFIYGNAIFKLIIGLGMILLLCFNLVCISSLVNYVGYLLIVLVVAIIVTILVFKNNIYKLFESEVLK